MAPHQTPCFKILQGVLKTGSFVKRDVLAFQMNQEHGKALRVLFLEAELSEFIPCEVSKGQNKVNESNLS